MSLGGRLILLRSVLSGIPVYWFALAKVPLSIIRAPRHKKLNFLWNGRVDRHKMHLVNWELVKRLISIGGLQIRDLSLANLALSGKLFWQLFVDKNYPVNKIFHMKYLKGGSLRNTTSANTPTGTARICLCSN